MFFPQMTNSIGYSVEFVFIAVLQQYGHTTHKQTHVAQSRQHATQ